MRSDENHERIAAAIAEANISLQINAPGILLSRDNNYQLSNRVAYAWNPMPKTTDKASAMVRRDMITPFLTL